MHIHLSLFMQVLTLWVHDWGISIFVITHIFTPHICVSTAVLHTVAVTAQAHPSTTRCATRRIARAPTRTSGPSSASSAATNTTTTSSTPGCLTSIRMVSTTPHPRVHRHPLNWPIKALCHQCQISAESCSDGVISAEGKCGVILKQIEPLSAEDPAQTL